jgi:hypothetical protein
MIFSVPQEFSMLINPSRKTRVVVREQTVIVAVCSQGVLRLPVVDRMVVT